MAELLFPSSPALTGALRAGQRMQARGYVQECRAMVRMLETAEPEQRDFVAGEIACVLHVSPATATGRLNSAMGLMAQPRLVAALESGQVGVGHALALLSEVDHLAPPHAAAVLARVLGDDLSDEPLDMTPGELGGAAKRAAITVDPDAARKRHQAAARTAGVRGRPLPDGMGQVVIDCTATQMAQALAAIRGRADAMTFDEEGLTAGQQQVAAFLHAVGCDRVRVQAVLECPVDRAVDLHALSAAAVWTVDVRMPVAVALGLSEHPGVLSGYGPIGADEARALLPAADLVRACIDSTTGEVLTVDAPLRARQWAKGVWKVPGRQRAAARRRPQLPGAGRSMSASLAAGAATTTKPPGSPPAGPPAGLRADPPADPPPDPPACLPTDPTASLASSPEPPADPPAKQTGSSASPPAHALTSSPAAALRAVLLDMATAGGTLADLTTDGYVPSEALGRLVDLRDVTSCFPGDATSTRRTDRDHRLPHPLGATAEWNLQNLSRRWHRAKQNGWHTRSLADGTIRWTSPSGQHYDRRPKRTPPPAIPPGTTLPPQH